MSTFFSDFFKVDQNSLDDRGAFNISLVNDLPLFIDPFLLFNSEESEYRKLHDGIIDYLVFLKDKAASGPVVDDLLRLWYCFPEVKQNWLGFSIAGNEGSGLGIDFARRYMRTCTASLLISATKRLLRAAILRRCA
jgi:hypothetical protein